MDTLVIVGGALLGMVCHIVKKYTEKEGNEIQTVRKWIIEKPFATIIAAVAAIAAAYQMNPDQGAFLAFGGTANPDQFLMGMFINAFVAGFASDSAFNRPGKGK